MRVLVVFASKHGSTEGIAREIGARLELAGLEIELASIGECGGLEDVGAVVLGSALYLGSPTTTAPARSGSSTNLK